MKLHTKEDMIKINFLEANRKKIHLLEVRSFSAINTLKIYIYSIGIEIRCKWYGTIVVFVKVDTTDVIKKTRNIPRNSKMI